MMSGDVIVARARALLGVRFRPQGRDPKEGLDCVGTAAAASGISLAGLRRDYRMRGDHLAEIEHGLCDLGCVPVPAREAAAGDVIVCEAGPAQFHLLLCTGDGFIHADAKLRMVVERPRPFPWPVASVWRLAGED
jgi:hypothetical protein